MKFLDIFRKNKGSRGCNVLDEVTIKAYIFEMGKMPINEMRYVDQSANKERYFHIQSCPTCHAAYLRLMEQLSSDEKADRQLPYTHFAQIRENESTIEGLAKALAN